MSKERKLVSSKSVRERYDNRSEMTLYRWQNDPELGFPQPIYINRRRYWYGDELVEWERSRATAGRAA